MTLSIRARSAAGIVLVLLITAAATIAVGVWLFQRGVSEQARSKTQHDLGSARLIYDAALGELGNKVRLIAFHALVREGLLQDRSDRVAQELEQIRLREGIDVLNLLDRHGRVLLRAQAPRLHGDPFGHDPVVRRVLAGEPLVLGTAVVPAEALRRESEELAQRARIEVPSASRVVEQGLVMQAAAAVTGQDGAPIGVLVGWKLLNRDVAIVDRIKRTLYHGEVYRGREVGEGTLCLGDVRVATNAVLEERRAIGSLIDPVVRARVLEEGKTRVDRANVVGETHLTAYEPLKDVEGNIVGMLCLGIPEARYSDVGRRALTIFVAISAGGLLLAFVVGGVLARGITRPIDQLVRTTEALAAGDLDARWTLHGGVAEVELLGTRFNEMADALRERDAQLRHRTQEQIGRSERLAMIGRLAAGVAHEINNPLGGIMLFSNLLLRKAPAEGPQRENLVRIADEAKRCQRIVAGLLDFARHREPKKERLMVHDVLEKTLGLVREQALFLNVDLREEFADAAPVLADASQLQQVFMNIVMNGAEAMEGRGALVIQTKVADGGRSVQVCFEDTGCGMTEEQLDKLFEPFFTTKEVGHGTGLGMSISRGIVENHGGTIWAVSAVGQGTKVCVSLPVAEGEV